MSYDQFFSAEKLDEALKPLDVPDYKRDASRGQNVVWLLENLKTRNSGKPTYLSAMWLLWVKAKTSNLLKEKRLKVLALELLALEPAETASTPIAQSRFKYSQVKGCEFLTASVDSKPGQAQSV